MCFIAPMPRRSILGPASRYFCGQPRLPHVRRLDDVVVDADDHRELVVGVSRVRGFLDDGHDRPPALTSPNPVSASGPTRSDGSSDSRPTGRSDDDHRHLEPLDRDRGQVVQGGTQPAGSVLWPLVPHQLAVSVNPSIDFVGNITSKLRL